MISITEMRKAEVEEADMNAAPLRLGRGIRRARRGARGRGAQLCRAGYRAMDAYAPFAVEGLAEALGLRRNGVPLACLLGGIFGGSLGYGMQCYSAIWDYPLNVGGRPLHSLADVRADHL